jgi:hypothetical protein
MYLGPHVFEPDHDFQDLQCTLDVRERLPQVVTVEYDRGYWCLAPLRVTLRLVYVYLLFDFLAGLPMRQTSGYDAVLVVHEVFKIRRAAQYALEYLLRSSALA